MNFQTNFLKKKSIKKNFREKIFTQVFFYTPSQELKLYSAGNLNSKDFRFPPRFLPKSVKCDLCVTTLLIPIIITPLLGRRDCVGRDESVVNKVYLFVSQNVEPNSAPSPICGLYSICTNRCCFQLPRLGGSTTGAT